MWLAVLLFASHLAGLSRPPCMSIAIVGGTGTVGAESARELSARGHDVEGTARLLAAEREAGVAHHVGVSIVGVDRVGGRYYVLHLDGSGVGHAVAQTVGLVAVLALPLLAIWVVRRDVTHLAA
jgi:nucleoside-diphosphate-sugar epimerase